MYLLRCRVTHLVLHSLPYHHCSCCNVQHLEKNISTINSFSSLPSARAIKDATIFVADLKAVTSVVVSLDYHMRPHNSTFEVSR